MSNTADQEQTPKVPATPEKNAEVATIEAEIKKLELEAKRLEVAERKANLQDTEERLAERQIKRENLAMRSRTNGITIRQIKENDEQAQRRCNHRKGGNGVDGIVGGKGDDPQYAVIKHTFCNGDVCVRCQRCGRTWKPPIEADYEIPAAYNFALEKYNEALEFNTRNTPSGSVMFRFSDGGAHYREVTRNSNLR